MGWNSLTRIWDEHPEHKQILQAMEYDGQVPPLDFSFRAFDPENGSKGKCPVTAEEWQKVGIQEQKKVPADSDQKAYALLEFCYGVQGSAQPLLRPDRARNHGPHWLQNAPLGSYEPDDRRAPQYCSCEWSSTEWTTLRALNKAHRPRLTPAQGLSCCSGQ